MGISMSQATYDYIKKKYEQYGYQTEVAKILGMNQSTISRVINSTSLEDMHAKSRAYTRQHALNATRTPEPSTLLSRLLARFKR